MKEIIICAMAKNEHAYINDWIRYHLSIGFDKVFIFDNDNPDSPNYKDCIDEDLWQNVFLIYMRGKSEPRLQEKCYTAFYSAHKNYFDWCAFIDIDEFIVLKDWPDIKTMLADKRFEQFDSIKLRWHMYGDDNVIKRDLSVSPLDFFKVQLVDHEFRDRGKQITRGGLQYATIFNHYCAINNSLAKQCTTSGDICRQTNTAYDIKGKLHDEAYINHYMTKTLDEFLNQKLHRGDAMFSRRDINLNYYWNINKKTPEKLEYIEKFSKEN